MRGLFWTPGAWNDYVAMQSERQLLKKANALIKDIQRNGYKCSFGKPEMLRNVMSGLASVRVDKKNRLVFRVDDAQVSIVECGGHYGDH